MHTLHKPSIALRQTVLLENPGPVTCLPPNSEVSHSLLSNTTDVLGRVADAFNSSTREAVVDLISQKFKASQAYISRPHLKEKQYRRQARGCTCSSTWEAEPGRSLSCRATWSTKQVPGQPELLVHRENLSRGEKRKTASPMFISLLTKPEVFKRFAVH